MYFKKFTVQIRKSHFATCTSLHLLPLLQYGGNVIIRWPLPQLDNNTKKQQFPLRLSLYKMMPHGVWTHRYQLNCLSFFTKQDWRNSTFSFGGLNLMGSCLSIGIGKQPLNLWRYTNCTDLDQVTSNQRGKKQLIDFFHKTPNQFTPWHHKRRALWYWSPLIMFCICMSGPNCIQ